MRCLDVKRHLLQPEEAEPAEVEAHLLGCAACAALVARSARLDSHLRSSLVVAPPPDLQAALLGLVAAEAQPAPVTTVERSALARLSDRLGLRGVAPRAVLTQLVALAAVILAAVQTAAWVQAQSPVIGNVGEAWSLLVGALAYLSLPEVDLQGLALWSAVGVAIWLVSEAPYGRDPERADRP